MFSQHGLILKPMRILLLRNLLSIESFYDNSIYSNEGNSCRESFSCDGHFGILYFRVDQLTKSLLQIHSIVADANVMGKDFQTFLPVSSSIEVHDGVYLRCLVWASLIKDTYEFGITNSTYQVETWYQSMSSKIIIDYTAFDKLSNYTLQVECRNIELLHNQDAIVYFQRES